MREQTAVVVLDGSQGEGGGAMVRTALAMAALTEQAVLIESVRGGTSHAGVDAEDVVFGGALAKSCEAEVSGLELGSSTIRFSPKRRPRALECRFGRPVLSRSFGSQTAEGLLSD